MGDRLVIPPKDTELLAAETTGPAAELVATSDAQVAQSPSDTLGHMMPYANLFWALPPSPGSAHVLDFSMCMQSLTL